MSVRLRASDFSGWRSPLVLEASCNYLPCGHHQHDCLLHRAHRTVSHLRGAQSLISRLSSDEIRLIQDNRPLSYLTVHWFGTLITSEKPLHFAMFCPLEANQRPHPHSWGKGLTQDVDTSRWDHGCHLRILPAVPPNTEILYYKLLKTSSRNQWDLPTQILSLHVNKDIAKRRFFSLTYPWSFSILANNFCHFF